MSFLMTTMSVRYQEAVRALYTDAAHALYIEAAYAFLNPETLEI